MKKYTKPVPRAVNSPASAGEFTACL